MFEKFSREAKLAVVGAQADAKELGAKQIGPEHVLLGAVSNAEPDLRAVLDAHDITTDGIRTTLAARTGEPPLGPDDAQALRSIGIDLDAVQASIAENFGPQAWEQAEPEAKRGMFARLLGAGHIPFTGTAKKTLELALREAIHRKDREISSTYLLLGILRGADPATTDLLGGRDAVSGLRTDLYAMLDRAA
ncbi:Clp protease N-terminal domain-containing protein [Nocardia sp. NPDC058705]|uniref:Clp protease N-terminal domain-containing protein n=1 Tax=Nocardia sp. NPDC058705 TaxID=3346609 RepID=UPI0036D0AF0D